MNKEKTKKALSIASTVFLYIFLILAALVLIITLTSKKSRDGAYSFFGHQIRLVTSNSMGKSEFTDQTVFDIGSIPVRSMILIELVPTDKSERDKWYNDLDSGDVLTFRYVYSSQVTITHRIDKITKNDNGGYDIILTGDNKNSETGALSQTIHTDDLESPNYVIGKVVSVSYPLGFIISYLKTVPGILIAIILPCLIIIALEIVRIFRILGEDKRKKAEEEAAQKELEISELRKRVAELEGKAEGEKSDTDKSDNS